MPRDQAVILACVIVACARFDPLLGRVANAQPAAAAIVGLR